MKLVFATAALLVMCACSAEPKYVSIVRDNKGSLALDNVELFQDILGGKKGFGEWLNLPEEYSNGTTWKVEKVSNGNIASVSATVSLKTRTPFFYFKPDRSHRMGNQQLENPRFLFLFNVNGKTKEYRVAEFGFLPDYFDIYLFRNPSEVGNILPMQFAFSGSRNTAGLIAKVWAIHEKKDLPKSVADMILFN